MGAKIDFDATTREFVITATPVNGVVEIDLQVDLYSDGKEDWVNPIYPDLAAMQFPIDAIGGNPFGDLTLGVSYLIKYGWHFRPYEGDHTLRLIGNIGTDGSWELVQDTVGLYRVRVENEVSALVPTAVAEIPASLEADISQIQTDISTIDTNVTSLLANQNLTLEQQQGEHTTSKTLGKLIIRNATVMRRWEADAWEDEGQTISYGTNANAGIESVSDLVEVAWS